jgi:hypothetical protein
MSSASFYKMALEIWLHGCVDDLANEGD